MDTIAVNIGNMVIYWSSIVILFGILSGFCLAYALYTAHSGRGSTMFVVFAFSLVFGVFISRLIHYYTHQEQYDGMFKALTDYSGGSYFLPGVILGVLAAAGLTDSLGLSDSKTEILDALAPGLMLTFAFVRLSALFTNACRGKILITNRRLQHLPIGSAVTTASGSTEYRFATFFVSFLLLLISAFILVVFYLKHHREPMKKPAKREGHVFHLFLIIYGVIELVMDSTRNDSTFPYFAVFQTLNRFASFISLTQLFAAISILILLIRYSKWSVKANGKSGKHYVLWGLYAVSLIGVGVSEYMVQRHGDMYRIFYSIMSGAAVLMAVSVILMYLSCRARRKSVSE